MEKNRTSLWDPLEANKIKAIRTLFSKVYPESEYGTLALKITGYWISMLKKVWNHKSRKVQEKDRAYDPDDPLSRISQNTLVITYADSVYERDKPTLVTMVKFLDEYFPAIRGMHMLPACRIEESRFNDGYFSQIERSRIHHRFGTNEQFTDLMERYFSMTDFVLNHVDIENPRFQEYIQGNDAAGKCFFIFSEDDYRERLKNGDFDTVFRPRPFPLFSIFRRQPEDPAYAGMSQAERVAEMGQRLKGKVNKDIPEPVISLLSIFNKIRNDQMLISEDYRHITAFRSCIEGLGIDPEEIFTVSATQEVQHTPYIFTRAIDTPEELLVRIGYEPEVAVSVMRTYLPADPEIFGKEFRALTTFSHVQVDLNTSSLEGLTMLADDFSWYLSMDLSMLRLDAANFAFKKWRTSCFGLPEVSKLMKILYLSMECVSPRIVANLEVNDTLTAVLKQMSNKEAPPPMMYDFHLAGILPAVFNNREPMILPRIFELISRYDVPESSIRFSLAESHDGKSVRGSMDLLTISERQSLADTVAAGGGKIKYKSVPPFRYAEEEFIDFCRQTGIDPDRTGPVLFEKGTAPGELRLRPEVQSEEQLLAVLSGYAEQSEPAEQAIRFFVNKVIHGREPYELCTTTRDSLVRLGDQDLEVARFLAFYTLAFALIGRNVKSIYFNDLMALPNDHEKLSRTGELRDLKRTKSEYLKITELLSDRSTFEGKVAPGMNNLIALVDSDPALHFRGSEAEVIGAQKGVPLAVIYNHCGDDCSLAVINVSGREYTGDVCLPDTCGASSKELYDNISGRHVKISGEGYIHIVCMPYQRMWFTREKVTVPQELLR